MYGLVSPVPSLFLETLFKYLPQFSPVTITLTVLLKISESDSASTFVQNKLSSLVP
jgi:hypothetical protein